MKVGILCPKAYGLLDPNTITNYGGAEVQFFLLAKQLATYHDIQVDFITADYGQERTINKENIRWIKSLNFKSNIGIQAIKLLKAMLCSDADTYLQITVTPYSFVLAIICRMLRRKFILFVAHDKESDSSWENNAAAMQKWMLKRAWLYNHSIIVQNNYQHQALLKKGVQSYIIPNWMPITIPATTPTLSYHLWMARAEKFKRPEIAIELARRHPLQKFMIICPPVDGTDMSYYDTLKSQASACKNIIFIDKYIPYAQLDSIFSSAISHIVTSDAEGFATTILQAGLHKIPIYSLAINTNEFITTYHTGYFANHDIEDFYTNFSTFVQELPNKNYGKNMHDYVCKNHDIIKNTAIIYKIITTGSL